jgi:multidrug efflux system outer membrane protein
MALDARLENLNRIIALQERSLEVANARKQADRGTDLPVQRFRAEVRKNQSEKLIVNQDIIQSANRINFLVNRFPQPVERMSAEISEFFDLKIHDLSVGVPSQLLLNRPDIRQAERDLVAAGLDVKVARVNFFPQLFITGGVGLQSFIINHLFEPNAVVGNITGGLVGPLVNFRAIRAQYLTANARQLQALYSYQRVVLEAVTEVINRISKVDNYARSIEIKKQQVESLEAAVVAATNLYQLPREELPVDYLDVLTAVPPILMSETGVILPPLPHHSGSPFPAGPFYPDGSPLPILPSLPTGPLSGPPAPAEPSPAAGPASPAGSAPASGTGAVSGRPSPPAPPPPPGPVSSPAQGKPATDLDPLPGKN